MVIKALLGDLKAHDAFHIIAGTSTGGIIACGLARPNPISIQDVINLYVDHGSEIFRKGLIDWSHYVYGPRYSPTTLENYLASKLGETYLSEVKDVELLVPSYAIRLPKENPPGNSCAPMFFRSWQARGLLLDQGAKSDEYDFKLESIARATSAAPTYFPPASIVNRAGQSFTMIDGGVFSQTTRRFVRWSKSIACTIQPISCLSRSELAASRFVLTRPAPPVGETYFGLCQLCRFLWRATHKPFPSKWMSYSAILIGDWMSRSQRLALGQTDC
jgi:predicted acylesterase/phospholipase RssA